MDNHNTAKFSYMDMEFKPTKFYREEYELFLDAEKPTKFEEMKKIAETLSKNIPFVRVDLYEINGEIYFGELTFYPTAGYIHFKPEEYDKIIGDMLELHT